MKHSLCLCLCVLLLVACGKEASQPKAAATAAPKQVIPEKKLPPTPQGKLPQMDPEKAKFIAVPSTPKDPEVKKVEEPATEVKKAAAPPAAVQPVPEVKKAAPAAEQK